MHLHVGYMCFLSCCYRVRGIYLLFCFSELIILRCWKRLMLISVFALPKRTQLSPLFVFCDLPLSCFSYLWHRTPDMFALQKIINKVYDSQINNCCKGNIKKKSLLRGSNEAVVGKMCCFSDGDALISVAHVKYLVGVVKIMHGN